MQTTTLRLAAAALALVFLTPGADQVRAQAIVSSGQSFIDARLIHGSRQSQGGRLAGLRLSLADGWKTYWRSPGEAGVPPVFDWSRSENLRNAEILWPRPELFDTFGLRTIGYSDEVVLPIRLVPEDPARPMKVELSIDLGVCRELCVLEQVALSETIGPDDPDTGANDITHAVRQVPLDGPENGLAFVRCRITGTTDQRRLDATLRFARQIDAPVVLVEGTDTMLISDAQTSRDGDDIQVSAEIWIADGRGWIDRSDFRLTVLDESFAADVRGCVTPSSG